MTESAARLVDHVLPRAPVRQWVLSPPYRLHYPLAWNHDQYRAVLGVYVHTLLAVQHLRTIAYAGWRFGGNCKKGCSPCDVLVA